MGRRVVRPRVLNPKAARRPRVLARAGRRRAARAEANQARASAPPQAEHRPSAGRPVEPHRNDPALQARPDPVRAPVAVPRRVRQIRAGLAPSGLAVRRLVRIAGAVGGMIDATTVQRLAPHGRRVPARRPRDRQADRDLLRRPRVPRVHGRPAVVAVRRLHAAAIRVMLGRGILATLALAEAVHDRAHRVHVVRDRAIHVRAIHDRALRVHVVRDRAIHDRLRRVILVRVIHAIPGLLAPVIRVIRVIRVRPTPARVGQEIPATPGRRALEILARPILAPSARVRRARVVLSAALTHLARETLVGPSILSRASASGPICPMTSPATNSTRTSSWAICAVSPPTTPDGWRATW